LGSRRSRASKVGLHVHCESCYSRRCRARVEVSVSCAVISCRLLCGASFHLCKEEEHLLLCPNVRVPCLNAEYGCPLHMTRSWQAAHLQVCPASVVSCSMEWNRWPADDAHSHPNIELHENLLKERESGGCLDLALALKDQDHLFHSLKMKKLFPELIKGVEEEEREKAAPEEACNTWVSMEVEPERELTQEEREAIAFSSDLNPELLESYSAYERMFSMEMGGCRTAGLAAAAGRKGQGMAKGKGLATLKEEDKETPDDGMSAAASNTCMDPCRQNKNKCAFPSTSSLSCPKDSKMKFVYGYVEPMKIITVRTFKIPTSFSARQSRIRNPSFYKRETRAVDTSDLGVTLEEMPVWEEIQATLMCSLEKEQRGHLIAEATSTDALLQDEGTQTYNFLSAPFRGDSCLADLTVGKPLELHLQLQVEGVTSRHHKASSAFTFLCGHTFHRREYGSHYKNVHSDIQMCVNGWFEQRCPLAYLGCTYSQKRFQPSTQEATVIYNEELGSFCLRPTIPDSLDQGSQPPSSSVEACSSQRRRGGRAVGGEDSLSSLPYEVLCHMASFLDSLSLSQLALVSRLMRDVCSSLLQERGMVTLRWERKTYSHGGAKWRVKQTVWQFSTLFSPVDRWSFRDVPPMSEHLKVCPCYQRENKTERILLPRISENIHVNSVCKGPTLVGLFQRKKIIM
uniref:F-box protein 40 n=1 Tax=Myripristis murdjan TaxID=586833 RepID=A0A667ZZ89_9TELE